MKIIIEYVLIENMLINIISLYTTSMFTKERGRYFWVAAFLGGCVTVVLPLFNLTAVGSFLLEIGLVCLYICISFKFKTLKKFLKLYICFYIVTFLYGGACYFVERYFGIQSTLIVLAVLVALFVAIKILAKQFTKKKNIEAFCFEVEIADRGKKSKWKAFLDTGNLLFDPLTDRPVILINFKVFSTLFKEVEIEDLLTKSKKIDCLKLAHYINFNTLNNSDKILVFEVDNIVIGENIVDKPMLGLSFKDFNAAFGTDIILHNYFANA